MVSLLHRATIIMFCQNFYGTQTQLSMRSSVLSGRAYRSDFPRHNGTVFYSPLVPQIVRHLFSVSISAQCVRGAPVVQFTKRVHEICKRLLNVHTQCGGQYGRLSPFQSRIHRYSLPSYRLPIRCNCIAPHIFRLAYFVG